MIFELYNSAISTAINFPIPIQPPVIITTLSESKLRGLLLIRNFETRWRIMSDKINPIAEKYIISENEEAIKWTNYDTMIYLIIYIKIKK